MFWRNRKIALAGSVAFRGSMPPRAHELTMLQQCGAELKPFQREGTHWALQLTHPRVGSAAILCLRDVPVPPAELLDFSAQLTEEERAEAKLAGSSVSVLYENPPGHLLRDRKRFLWLLRQIMGDDGVVAIDHVSTRFWSRAALDDELSHESDVDVDALYDVQYIVNDQQKVEWLHTHGLAALGKYDFDILHPHESLWQGASDVVRAIAFASLEDTLKPGTDRFDLFEPGGGVRAIDAATFQKKAPRNEASIRCDDPDHTPHHMVLCDPAAGFLGKLLRRYIRAARCLQGGFPEDRGIMRFSTEATDLTAERARGTVVRLGPLVAEIERFKIPALVKLGYPIDNAPEDEREHMWFRVHGVGAKTVDATLINQPFNIARMKEGQRDTHPLDLLTDWMIITPFGQITPRNSMPLRLLRTHQDELLEALRQAEAEGAGN